MPWNQALAQLFRGYHGLAVERRPNEQEEWSGIITETMLQNL